MNRFHTLDTLIRQPAPAREIGPVFWVALRAAILVAFATALILVFLPAALGAA